MVWVVLLSRLQFIVLCHISKAESSGLKLEQASEAPGRLVKAPRVATSRVSELWDAPEDLHFQQVPR